MSWQYSNASKIHSHFLIWWCIFLSCQCSWQMIASLCLSLFLRRPLWSPSRQTSSLGSSTCTCSARRAPCTASSTTRSPTSTCLILNLAPPRRALSSETSPSAGKDTHTQHAHDHLKVTDVARSSCPPPVFPNIPFKPLLPLSVCWLVGWFVSRIKQKRQNGFPRNLDGGWVSAQNRSHFWCTSGILEIKA